MSDVCVRQADLPPRPPRRLLRDDLAHAGHRRPRPRHRGARGVRGGPAHPARQARPRGPASTTRWSQLMRANVRTPDQTHRRHLGAGERQRADGAPRAAPHGRLRPRRARRSSATSSSRRSERAMRAGHPRGARRHLSLRASRPTASTRRSTSRSRSRWPATRSSPTTPAPRPQQPRAINCVLAYTYAMTAYAVRCALLPGLPNNEGMYRPVRVEAPEGCLLNPRFPAAVVSRAVTGHYVPVLVLGALHQVIPERVMAGGGLAALGGDPVGHARRRQSRTRPCSSSTAAWAPRAVKDGENVLSWPSNISSTPVEVAERNSPLFFHYKRLRPGSGGAGRFRGGLGQDILIESESRAPDRRELHGRAHRRSPRPASRAARAGGRGDVRINGRSVDNRRQHVLIGRATASSCARRAAAATAPRPSATPRSPRATAPSATPLDRKRRRPDRPRSGVYSDPRCSAKRAGRLEM